MLFLFHGINVHMQVLSLTGVQAGAQVSSFRHFDFVQVSV